MSCKHGNYEGMNERDCELCDAEDEIWKLCAAKDVEIADLKAAYESLFKENAARRAAALASPTPSVGEPAKVSLAPSRVGWVYLAGPMTGYDDYNFPLFNRTAASLRAEGFNVINPAEHGIVEGAEWADYLRFDLAKIAGCELIALLPGWEASKGARLEVHVAQALGMSVRCLDGATPPAAPAATEAPSEPLPRCEHGCNGCENCIDDDRYADDATEAPSDGQSKDASK